MSNHPYRFLHSGGQTGALMRSLDWSTSPLGSPAAWPLSLQVLVRHMLASSFPMFIAWGPKLGFVYNDAYAALLGERHPNAMGKPFQEIWPEVWDDIAPIVDKALTGKSTYGENQPLKVRRHGQDERAWFTFSYSPAYDDNDSVGGMYCTCVETTAQVRMEKALFSHNEALESKAAITSAERNRIWLMSRDILAIASLDGHIISLNPAATDILGWSEEEARAIPFIEFAHPAYREQVLHAMARLATGETLSDVQIPSRHSNGSYRWLSWTVVPDDGKLYGVARDITESKQQQTLSAATHNIQLGLALEAGQLGAWQWDVQRGEVTWWPGMAELHGLAPGTKCDVMDGYQELVHPDDRALIAGNVSYALRHPNWDRTEYRVIWPDGSIHWLEGRGETFFDEQGNAIAMAGVCMDITHRKRSEHDRAFVAKASEELATLVDYPTTMQKIADLAVPNFADWCAVDIDDNQGNLKRVAVAHINPEKVALAHELHAKYPPDPNKEGGTWSIIRTRKPEFFPEITDELLAGSIQDPQQLADMRALGLYSYIGVPLCRRGRAFGVLTFITAESRRLYRTEDLALAEELAHRASIAIENAELYQALKDADKAKDQFIATLAHELRNPLAAISAVPSVMRLVDHDAAVTRRSIDILERQSNHLTRLVDDLLDVSRITTGKIELKKEWTTVAALLRNAVEMSAANFDAAGNTLHIDLPETPSPLMADPVRLEQVFANLLNNAAKFTPPGGRIDVRLEQSDTHYRIHVKDTGIGIAPGSLKTVFTIFAQEKTPQQHAQGGLGIGLALVEALVGLHGGRVEARSDGPGTGAEFIVDLPKPREDFSRADATAATAMAKATGSPKLRKVLLVEDNRDVASVMQAMLEGLGHETIVAHSGADAIGKTDEFRFDAILLDIGLPDMEGTRVGQHIRATGRNRETRIIGLSGWTASNIQALPGAECFDDFWVKPVTASDLKSL